MAPAHRGRSTVILAGKRACREQARIGIREIGHHERWLAHIA
jgi:hypothetical protein